MASAVYKNILNTCICEEFESILDQGGICEGKETLQGLANTRTGLHKVKGFYSWTFEGKRCESSLK